MLGIELLVMLAMIAANSVLAAFEIALASVPSTRLRHLAEQKHAGARTALHMKENIEASLAVVQVGITLAGAVAAATGGAGAAQALAPWLQEQGLSQGLASFLALAVVVAPLTAVTIVFGELVPKVYALRNQERVCLGLAPLLHGFSLVVRPAVWFFEAVVLAILRWTERARPSDAGADSAALQDLYAITAQARSARLIGAREENIIVNAARLSRRPVREIVVPADQISMLDVHASLADALVAAHLDMHTRFPVSERPGDAQAIVGYVNFKDLVALLHLSPHDPSLRAVVRPLLSLDAALPLTTCLEQLIRERTHIALVRDAAGQVVGMITLEDILEELVGDIEDEYGRLPTHLVASGTAWVAGGGVPLARLREATQLDLAADPPPQPAERLADWIAGHLGRAPRGGDRLERGGLRVLVRKVRRRQVLEAQLVRPEARPQPTPPGQ